MPYGPLRQPDDTHLIAGTTTGMLSIRRREVRQQEQAAAVAAASAQPVMHAGMRGYFVRGKGYQGGQVRDHTIAVNPTARAGLTRLLFAHHPHFLKRAGRLSCRGAAQAPAERVQRVFEKVSVPQRAGRCPRG